MSTVFTILGVDLLSAPADAAAGSMERLGVVGESTGGVLGGALQVGALAAAAGIVAVGAALGAAVSVASGFQDAMSKTAALTNTSSEAVGAMEEKIVALSTTMPVSAKELADAMFLVVSAGFSGDQAMTVLTASARAAASGLGETKTVADAVTSTLNAYKMGADQASHVTDILTNAVVQGKASADTFAPAIGRILPIASAAGVSFEQVAASMATMTRVGLNTDEAATALRGTLGALEKPGTAASKALQDIGLSAEQVRQEIRDKGLLATLQDLMDRTGGNIETLGLIIPNIRALTGVLATAGSQADTYSTILGSMNDAAGLTNRAFEKVSTDLSFQLGRVKTNFEALGIAVGAKFLPYLTPVVKAFADGLPGAFAVTMAALAPLGDALSSLGETVMPTLEAIPDAWRTIGQVFANDWSPDESLGPFINAVGNAALGVKGLIDAVIGLPEPVKTAGLAFAAVMLGMGPLSEVLGLLPVLFGALVAPIAAVLSPLGLLALGVAGLAAAWDLNLGDVQTKTSDFLGIVGPAFSGLGAIMQTAVSGDIAGAFSALGTLISTTGLALGPMFASWGAEFVAWVPGAVSSLVATLTAQVALVPWATIWAASVTAATALGTYLSTLVIDFATWLTAQVVLIPWPLVWAKAVTVATTLGTFLLTQVVDFGSWLTAQVALIPWATVWGAAKTVATALATFVATQAVDFGSWLAREVGLIPWPTVWANAKTVATDLATFVGTQTIDFATWLGAQVTAIPWGTVWGQVTGMLEAMTASFTTAASGINWGDVITANATMAQDMSVSLGTKLVDAFTGVDWTTVGQNIGRSLVTAIAVAFGMAEVTDAWAVGFGGAIARAAPAMAKALIMVLVGVLEGALETAWNLAVASWVPGAPTVHPPTGPGTGWTATPPGGQPGPLIPGLGTGPPPATGTYVPPEQIPQGPEQGPSIPPGFTPGELTPQPAAVSAAPKQYAPIDNSSRASFAQTAYPIFLDAAGGNADLAQMMIAAAISENKTVGSGQDIGAGNNFYGIKAPGPSTATGSFTSPTWEQGQGTTTASFASFPDPVTGANGFMQFLQENPRYAPALAAYQKSGNAQGLFTDINAAGYASDPNWGSTIANIQRNQVAPAIASGSTAAPAAPAEPPPPDLGPILGPSQPPPVGGLIPSGVANFEQNQQAWDAGMSDANAICGPHLATLFASAVGRPPTRDEAVQLAQQMNIYDPTGSGSGIKNASQYDEYASALIQQINPGSQFSVAQTNVTGVADASQQAQASLAGGAPIVGFNTPTHYFGATSFDPTAQTFHVGGTGTSLAGGSPDMTIAQINAYGQGITSVITLLGQFSDASNTAGASVASVGQDAAVSTPQLSAIGVQIDPTIQSFDAGAAAASTLGDAIIQSAATQGIATQSASDYSVGLTDQTTALEGVLSAFSATTPAAADLLTQLQAGTITTDQAAVSFAGLAATTADSYAAIGVASSTVSDQVVTDLTTMATDGSGAVATLNTDVSGSSDEMKTSLLTDAASMQTDGTTSLQGLQTDGTVAMQGLQTDATTAAQTMGTDVAAAADTMNVDASGSADAMNLRVSSAADDMNAKASDAASTMQTDVSGAADTMNTDTSGSADAMNIRVTSATDDMGSQAAGAADTMATDVSGSADTMNTDTSGSADSMNIQVVSAANDMGSQAAGAASVMATDVAGAADTMNTDTSGSADTMNTNVVGSVGDMASGTTDALGTLAAPLQTAADGFTTLGSTADDVASSPPDFSSWAKAIDTVKGAADKALSSVKALSNQSIGSGNPSLNKAGKAAGGPVYSDGSYIVGEKGPELFVPAVSGTIVPNHKLRGLADGGIVQVGPANPAPGIDTGPVAVTVDDATITLLQGIQDRADELILRGDALATALSILNDSVINNQGSTHDALSLANDSVGKVADAVTAGAASIHDQFAPLQAAITAGDGLIITAVGAVGTVTATVASLMQGLITLLTKPATTPGHATVPTAPGVAAPSVPAGPPTAPLPQGMSYVQVSPGVWSVKQTGLGAVPTDVAQSVEHAPVIPGQNGVPIDAIPTLNGSMPFITPPGEALSQLPPPSTGGQAQVNPVLAGYQPPYTSPGGGGNGQPQVSPVLPGFIPVGNPLSTFPVTIPGQPQVNPVLPGTPLNSVTPPSISHGQTVTTPPAQATPSAGLLGVTAPITAADASIKKMSTDVTANTTAMQTGAALQAKNMADKVGKSSDQMQNDVGINVTSMVKATTDATGTMSDGAVLDADNMQGGTTDAANLMQGNVQTAAELMRDGAIAAAGLMNDGVSGAAGTMHDNVSGAASAMADVVAGPTGSLESMYSQGITWMGRLNNEGIDQFTGTAGLRAGVLTATNGMSEALNASPTGSLYDTYSRGVAWLGRLNSEGIDQFTGTKGLAVGVVSATGDLNAALNDAPNGPLYNVYSKGVTWLGRLNVEGVAQAGLAQTGISGALGGIKTAADLLPVAYTGIKNAGDTLAGNPLDPGKWVAELGKIEQAAKDAAKAINAIPSAPKASSTASAGVSLPSSSQAEAASDTRVVGLLQQIADVLGSIDGKDPTHQVNLALTLTAETADYAILEAQARSAT